MEEEGSLVEVSVEREEGGGDGGEGEKKGEKIRASALRDGFTPALALASPPTAE